MHPAIFIDDALRRIAMQARGADVVMTGRNRRCHILLAQIKPQTALPRAVGTLSASGHFLGSEINRCMHNNFLRVCAPMHFVSVRYPG